MDFFGVCTTYMDSLVLLPFVYLPHDTCFKDGHNTQPPMTTNNTAMESSHVHKEIHLQLVHVPLLYFPSACKKSMGYSLRHSLYYSNWCILYTSAKHTLSTLFATEYLAITMTITMIITITITIAMYNDSIVYMITSTYTYVFPVFSHLTRQHSHTVTNSQCTFLRILCHPFNMPPEIFCKDASCFCIPASSQLWQWQQHHLHRRCLQHLPVSSPLKHTLSNKRCKGSATKKMTSRFVFYQL